MLTVCKPSSRIQINLVWVHSGRRAYVGTDAVIVNDPREESIVIQDDVVIGTGACVIKSVPAELTVVGAPAKPPQRS